MLGFVIPENTGIVRYARTEFWICICEISHHNKQQGAEKKQVRDELAVVDSFSDYIPAKRFLLININNHLQSNNQQ